MDDIIGKSFIARVRSVTPQFSGPIGFSSRHEFGKSGWLLRGGSDMPAVPLQFDYLKHEDDRLYYDISAAPARHEYAGAKLGVSINGYLGFYQLAKVTDAWKVELIGDGSIKEGFRFYLRDSDGQRVAVSSEEEQLGNLANPQPSNLRRYDYLNVSVGQIIELEAQVLEVL
jgi:hypothetical protein